MSDQFQDKSLGDLLSELSRETSTLVRKEMELATAEISAKARDALVDIGMAAAGGALAHAGFLVLLAAFVLGLSEMGVQAWLSALIVGLATVAGGYLLANRGLGHMRRASFAPTKTIETLKESARWTTRQGA